MPPSLQLLGVAAGTSFLLDRLAPAVSLGLLTTTALLFVLEFIVYEAWLVIVYPRFFSPLRHLPTPPDGRFFTGQTRRILKEPSGMPMRDWVENVPNDGLIKYSIWFQERVLLTDPRALAEVLVTKNYEFVKPYHFRNGLGRILGIGILLAEGDEHKRQRKVCTMNAFLFESKSNTDLRPRTSCQPSLTGISRSSTQSSGASRGN